MILRAACFALALWQVITGRAEEMICLPLKVHLVTGVEMVREAKDPTGALVRTVMNMPLKEDEMRAVMEQVNVIWRPAGIGWQTDPKIGGGGIVTETAGGGKLGAEKLQELAGLVTASSRGEEGESMKTVFPALADPAQNRSLSGEESKAEMYHLYVFPYVGQTLQGMARCPGTFAVIGAFSDKNPNQRGFPRARPLLVPAAPGAGLQADDFPAEGALSATAAHELGHNLGLRHSDEGMPDNLMKGHVKLRLSSAQIRDARKQAMKGPRLQ